ncbi:MAG TPA: hypothetical protein VGM76_04245 [Lacipirellulaceae bacterium]|jgi:hypothetical protein
MTFEAHFPSLTDEQKRNACAIMSAGCDRETAAKFLSCSLFNFQREMSQDSQFAADIRQAEATSELNHLRNVQRAARDDKQWRASVWWLERRAPERFGRRSSGAITARQLEQVISHLVSLVMEEIHDVADLERVVSRMHRAASSLQELCRDEGPPTALSADRKLITGMEQDEKDSNSIEEDDLSSFQDD